MWAHKATDPNGAKGQRIAQAGGSLRRDMIAFFRDESSAFAFERELIAQGRGALTNIVGGIVDQRTAAARRAAVMLSNMVPLDVWLARAHRDRIEAAGRLHPDGAAGFYMESRNWLERMAHA